VVVLEVVVVLDVVVVGAVVVVDVDVVVGRVVVVVDVDVVVVVDEVVVVDDVELVVPGTNGVGLSAGRLRMAAAATPITRTTRTAIATHSHVLDLDSAPGTSGAVRSVQAWPSQ